MRKLKGIISLIVALVLLGLGIFSLFYFSRDSKDKKVVVTIFPLYEICREILGSNDDILLLEDNGVDMHSFQPTAQDISAISKSELFVYVGGESDKWVDNVIASANSANLSTLRLMDNIKGVEESMEGILDSEHEHEHDEDNHEHEEDVYDEHIWLSLNNMIAMTKAVLDKLILVYPHTQELLKANAEEYIDKLQTLEGQFKDALCNKDTTIVFADRFPFTYLAKDYDLNFLAAFHGCSTDTQASVSVITGLIDKINNEKLNYICVLETSDMSIATSVVRDSRCREGVKILVIDSCQSVSFKDVGTMSYIEIMQNNLENFKKAINNESN